MGGAGTVLLKNVNNTLPLRAPANIGVYGNDAGDLLNGLYPQSGVATNPLGFEYGILVSYPSKLSAPVKGADKIQCRLLVEGVGRVA